MQTESKGKWRGYLDVIAREDKDWRDPTFLMAAYNISRKAAQSVIDMRVRDLEVEDKDYND